MNFNKVFFAGNITRKPELKTTQSGKVLTTVSVASNHKYKDKQDVCYLECTAWEKTAETIVKWFDKGDPIFLEGRLVQDNWTDQVSGAKRSKIKMLIQSFSFTDKQKKPQDYQSPGQPADQPQDPPASVQTDPDPGPRPDEVETTPFEHPDYDDQGEGGIPF